MADKADPIRQSTWLGIAARWVSGPVRSRMAAVALTYVLSWCTPGAAAEPIPADKRIPATIARTIATPAEQPMHMPTDVAVDSQGRIFVADGANDRIVRFSPEGELEAAISEFEDHKLNRPVGLAIDAADRLWIADTGNHRLVVISADGNQVEPITPLKIDQAWPCDPTDLVVTPDGKRTYIVDNDHHRILVRENATRKWSALGSGGQALGHFQWPFMICIGQDNYVYVSEAIGSRVQQITPTDRWAGQIGRWGMELGQFYRPKGLAVDRQGRLFVSDSTMGVIQVFSARGAVQGVLTDKDGHPLRFDHPMGMCFDSQGQLFVVELRANRVAVVSIAAENR